MQNMKVYFILLVVVIIGFKQVENKKITAIKGAIIAAKIGAVKDVGNKVSDAAFKKLEAVKSTGKAIKSVVLLPIAAAKKVAAAKIAKIKAIKAIKLAKLKKIKKPLSSISPSIIPSSPSLLPSYQPILPPPSSNIFGIEGNAQIKLPNIQIPNNVDISISSSNNNDNYNYRGESFLYSLVPNVIASFG